MAESDGDVTGAGPDGEGWVVKREWRTEQGEWRIARAGGAFAPILGT